MDRGGWWGYPQADMHMVAARLDCERAMVGTRWATPRPDCMDMKAAWSLGVSMTT